MAEDKDNKREFQRIDIVDTQEKKEIKELSDTPLDQVAKPAAPQEQEPPQEQAETKSPRSRRSATANVFLTLAIVCFVAGAAMALYYYHNYLLLERMKAAVEKDGYYAGILVDGQSLEGMSLEDAQALFNQLHAQADAERVVRAAYEGREFTLQIPASYNTDQVLVDAYNTGREGTLQERYAVVKALESEPREFSINVSLDTSGVDGFIRSIEQELNVAAVDAAVDQFDAESKTFTFVEEVEGRQVKSDALREQVQALLQSQDFTQTITIETEAVPAKVTKSELETQNKLLGSFTTTTTSSSARNKNIELCSAAFNGHVVAPGETFSINDLTGPRTKAKGYREAGAIQGGKLVPEPGGGVCQVSSTLFNAVVRAGMEIVERHNHSWPSDYVKIGMDAAIDYPGKDFKFKNVSPYPIFLASSFANRKLTVEVYGAPLVEEGVSIDLRSTLDSTISRGSDRYEFDASVAPGQTVQERKGRDGKRSTTYIQYIKDEKVIEEKVLFTSYYPPITAIYHYGPDPVYEDPGVPMEEGM